MPVLAIIIIMTTQSHRPSIKDVLYALLALFIAGLLLLIILALYPLKDDDTWSSFAIGFYCFLPICLAFYWRCRLRLILASAWLVLMLGLVNAALACFYFAHSLYPFNLMPLFLGNFCLFLLGVLFLGPLRKYLAHAEVARDGRSQQQDEDKSVVIELQGKVVEEEQEGEEEQKFEESQYYHEQDFGF